MHSLSQHRLLTLHHGGTTGADIRRLTSCYSLSPLISIFMACCSLGSRSAYSQRLSCLPSLPHCHRIPCLFYCACLPPHLCMPLLVPLCTPATHASLLMPVSSVGRRRVRSACHPLPLMLRLPHCLPHAHLLPLSHLLHSLLPLHLLSDPTVLPSHQPSACLFSCLPPSLPCSSTCLSLSPLWRWKEEPMTRQMQHLCCLSHLLPPSCLSCRGEGRRR